MAVGIASSLNSTLARLNSIESNFSALETFANKINSIQNPAMQSTDSVSDVQNKDFKAIFDEKMASDIEQEKKVDEILKENLPEAEIEPKELEAINLKSKIDLKAQTTDIDKIIETFAEKYNVDEDFIKAIIKQESGFNPKATSKKGAMGLMQLMPKTAKSLGVNNAYDPWENIEGGVKYLKGFLDKYDNNHELALAAYNAGANAVKRYGGIPPYKETQNYVKAIMSNYNKIKGLTL